VERGKGDGLYINVSGIGVCEYPSIICPQSIRPGDKIILSGDIGRYGMTIMAMREGLEFESSLISDCAELWSPVQLLLKEGIKIHCLRDLTRGGIYTALVELAESSALSLFVDEEQIPICSEVQGACEILGLDPMYVADEGRFIAFIPKEDATNALSILHQYHCTENTMVIGEVTKERSKEAILINIIGTQVRLSRLPGDQLPRIC
jgi:hydrogenase expression/formation protein HypE